MQENIIKISNLLNKRFDPFFYRKEFLTLENRMQRNRVLVTLMDICEQITDGTHITPQYTQEGVKFLSVKDVRENEIFFDKNVKYISTEEHYKIKKRAYPESGDILLTKIGATYGLAATVPDIFEEFSIFVSLALLKPKKDIVLSQYITYFLNSSLAKKQMDRNIKGVGVPDLHLEDIRCIKIPLIKKDLQKELIDIMYNAYNHKKKNEIKIQEYLNSIDDYILKKLGIELPNKDMKKTFTSNVSSFVGNRYDPAYNQPYYAELVESFSNKNGFKLCCLSDLISTQTVNTSQYDFINYIDLGSIDDQLNSIQYKMVEKENIPSRAKMHVAKGDFIFSGLAGSISSIAIIDKQLDNMVASTGFYVIKSSKEYNNEYLFALFKTKFMQTLLIRHTSGAVMPAINAQELKNIFIPLPPLKIQEEIALTVKQIIRNAKSLEIEANQNLLLAKQEFENILLGV